uniref:Uncharacterized protein n=1 Tax=Romanomermis culicivorax TaxID=13658 RepID=A0A915L833_ROMCU
MYNFSMRSTNNKFISNANNGKHVAEERPQRFLINLKSSALQTSCKHTTSRPFKGSDKYSAIARIRSKRSLLPSKGATNTSLKFRFDVQTTETNHPRQQGVVIVKRYSKTFDEFRVN